MRPVTVQEAAYLLHLVLLYLGVHRVGSSQAKREQPRAQHQQQEQGVHYSYQYGDNQQYDNSHMEQNVDYGVYDDKKEETYCYSCTYHVRKGNAAGHENCRDPFIKTDIARVPCTGTCAKIYHKISDTEYTITRICLPNCKDVQDDKGYTQCCTGSLCNGGASSVTVSCLLLTSSLAASTWYGLR